jgi:hypothetical protein
MIIFFFFFKTFSRFISINVFFNFIIGFFN